MRPNAILFIAAQVGSRFANSFLTTAVRYELLEIGGVRKFASAQVANQVSRVFTQQLAGLLTINYSLKRLYVIGEACNLLLVLAMVPAMFGIIDASAVLFVVNIGLGLTQAFSQPIAKSLPPAVVVPEDLAIVQSWDLTGDKIARNLAPMSFAAVSSSLGFKAAIGCNLAFYLILVAMKQTLSVADQLVRQASAESETSSALDKMLSVFRQVRDGMLSLRSDRVIGLLILNTLVTNMIVYPLGSLVFPVIFKAIPEGALEQEGSFVSSLILGLQSALGIQKQKAWMNYAALVSLGAVIGPFFSNAAVYQIKAYARKDSDSVTVNWIGLNCGIIGQLATMLAMLVVLSLLQVFTAGTRILSLFVVWGAMNGTGSVFTVYFNAHSTHRLERNVRGRFVANILTLFSLANSAGSLLYGWALSSDDVEAQILTSAKILFIAVIARIALIILLRTDNDGRETVMIRSTKKE